ncbi:MAG: 4-hydroxy-3-methylbut-2-enyl diphosphate reductase [Deferrisomatales bacterium]|nr:4-hydroxy-3-methylbut-2-enyl diphosphate reductase [Deferrisomatales bacterium]
MEIVVARSAGFCMGVRRAVGIAREAAAEEQGEVFTNGPLIHNPQALEKLRREGVIPLGDEEAVPPAAVIVRAHGIPPETRDRLQRQATRVVDATCPKVATIQKKIAKYSANGYAVVIAGDADHPEVVGLLGYARGGAHVVSDAAAVAELPPLGKVLLVAQTTQDEEIFEAIRRRVLERFPGAQALSTICQSTHRRQTEVRQMAGEVDAMVVIGGRNSANTCRLAEICRHLGTPAYHVETAEELPLAELRQLSRVGVTAGASTPADVIEQVVERLRDA